jgi:ubiquinone/menaquinone biosynthesis C-methylase UbiE
VIGTLELQTYFYNIIINDINMNFQGTNAEKIFHGQASSRASQMFYSESAPLFAKIIKENLEPGTYSLVDLGGHKGEFLSELSKSLPEYNFESIIVDKMDGLDQNVSAQKIVGDIINAPLLDKSADIVILRYVLPWDSFENQKLILNEVKRLCKKLCIIQHQGADSADPIPMQQAALKLFAGNPPRLKRENGFFTESKQVEKWMDELHMPYKKVQERKVETLSEIFLEKFELNEQAASIVKNVLSGCDYIMQTTWVLNFNDR